jgi:hypothetical protein
MAIFDASGRKIVDTGSVAFTGGAGTHPATLRDDHGDDVRAGLVLRVLRR